MGRVEGKAVIITGAASGIGEATAKLMAKEGARVAVLDIDDENGKRVVTEILADGGKADFWHMNVACEEEVKITIAAVYKKYSKLNVLVNNAGVAAGGMFTHTITTQQFDEAMAVDLKGPFWCTKYSIPLMMKSGGGSVVNISSIMGILGGPGMVYNTAKAALRHMTKCDAVSYAKDNIRFNSVHPGYIVTPQFKRLASKTDSVEESMAREGRTIPLGRMGMPQEIAYGILFLASDESSYMTGTEMIIDGGKVIV
ncbi:MAG TPA: glucose 1-dehydrogenase [Dehalococcoidales bacterium]|nr:glucose 1-dehydrogenase [Dehalococcoidales bacterium]